jgi:hypothetical protein
VFVGCVIGWIHGLFVCLCAVLLPGRCSQYSKDPDDVITKLGLPVADGVLVPYVVDGIGSSSDTDADPFPCTVCVEPCPLVESFALHCHHRFCNSCWQRGITEAVVSAHLASTLLPIFPKSYLVLLLLLFAVAVVVRCCSCCWLLVVVVRCCSCCSLLLLLLVVGCCW